MRVTTLPGRSGPGKQKNDVSWRYYKAGFWTFIKPLALLLFFFTISSLQAQTTIPLSDQVIAKFGVEADLYANINELDPSNSAFDDTDDWFLDDQWTGDGLNVIAQSGTDSGGNNVADVISTITSGNFSGEIRMSKPIYSMVDGYLWIDAVYFRDQRTNGPLVDATFFTSGNDKNFEDPINGWTIGQGNGGPQKNDIIEFFGHLRRDDGSPNDNEYAIVGATTRSQNGTSHLDFEYFRKDMVLNAAGTGLEYDPERYGDLEGAELAEFLASLGCNRTYYQFNEDYSVLKHGDVVFSVNYESGGDNINVELFVWIKRTGLDVTAFNMAPNRPFTLSDKNGNFEFYACPTDTNFGYAKIQPKDGSVLPVTAQVNESAVLGPPWGSFNSNGQPRDDLPALAFVELSLDATELGLDTRSNQGECESPLGSVIVKTRSSAPFTAEQKDLAGPVNLGNTPPVSVELADIDFCESEPEDLVAEIMPEVGDYLIQWYLLSEDLTSRSLEQEQSDINDGNPGARSYTPTESGTYEVVVTVILGDDVENLGCFASARATVEIFDDPDVDIQTTGVCAGEDAVFTATPSGAANYFFFNDADGDGEYDDDGTEAELQDGTMETYTDNSLANDYWVGVVVTTSDGCTDSDSVQAIIYTNPIADIQTTGVCAGEDAVFTATPSGAANYFFFNDADGDGAYDDDGTEATLQDGTMETYTDNGLANDYWVGVIVTTSDGCTDSDSVQAIIYTNPTADIQTTGVCAGEDAVFTATPSGAANYFFFNDADGDGAYDDDGTEATLQDGTMETYTDNGLTNDYWVGVVVTTSDGCTDSDSVQAIIYTNPMADIQTTGVCTGEDAVFTATPSGAANYFFFNDADGDGAYDDDGTEATLQDGTMETYTDNGLTNGYWVGVVVTTSDGCTDSDSVQAIIYTDPIADIQTTGVCTGEDAVFTATPSGAANYFFFNDADGDGAYDDDGTEATLQDGTMETYTDNGLTNGYWVGVIVTTSDGCTDSDSVQAIIYTNPIADIQTTGVCTGEDAVFTATPSGAANYFFFNDADGDGAYDDDGTEATLQDGIMETYTDNGLTNGYWVGVVVTTSDGCTDSDSVQAIIYTNPILNGGTICVGDSIDIGIGPGTYESSNDAVATVDNAGLVTGVSAGSVTITYTDGNNCSDTAIVTVEDCCSEETAYALGDFNPGTVGFCGGNINSSNWGWSNGPYD